MAEQNNGEKPLSEFKDLQESGMATALSIDMWDPPSASQCNYSQHPDLSVNFICTHPRKPPSMSSNTEDDDDDDKQDGKPAPPNKAEAARYQEIFVDLVGMHCAFLDAASRHVLDDRFDSFLQKGERNFKDSLLHFMTTQTDETKSTRAFQFLEKTLQKNYGIQCRLFKSQHPATAAPAGTTK